jgi:hypothetical protein
VRLGIFDAKSQRGGGSQPLRDADSPRPNPSPKGEGLKETKNAIPIPQTWHPGAD